MPEAAHKITPADILSDREYEARRDELRKEAIAVKKHRRVEVGPFATFYFENYAHHVAAGAGDAAHREGRRRTDRRRTGSL